MAEENNTIRINRDKETPVEFQVKIEGVDDLLDKTTVRLVVKTDKYNLSFPCEHGTDENWKVTVPAMPTDILPNGTYDMVLEVIVDNYFFKPASGQVTLLSEPTVTFAPKKEEKKEEATTEGMGQSAGDSQGQTAPTNALLFPEKKPRDIHKSAIQKSPEDELVDVEKLASEVVPGQGEPYAQDDDEEDKFNPQKVAETIILDTLGISPKARAKLAKQGPGFLFKRGADGRPIVEGLESPDFKEKMRKAALEATEERVKKILRDLANEPVSS